MSFLKRQPLSRQVVAVAVILLLPLFVAIAWSAIQSRRERQAEVRGEALSVAVSTAASLDGYLERLDAIASVLVRTPAIVDDDRSRIEPLFADLLHEHPVLANLLLEAPDGSVRVSGLGDTVSGEAVSGRWATQVFQNRRPMVGDFALNSSGKPVVTFAYPVVRDAAVAGALGLLVDLTQLQDAFANIPLPADSVITVVDRTNRVLMRSRDASRFLGTSAGPIEWSALPRATERIDIDGVDRLSGDASVKRAPWILSVGIPQTVVAARVRPLWQRNVAIAVCGLGSFVFLSLWLARQTTAHVTQLRKVVEHIAGGDLSPPSSGEMPNLEFAQLHDSFATMAANLRETQTALDRQIGLERKLNESLQSLQRQVVRQERLAAVGLLASGVAHEVNNPLQAIAGAAELLEREVRATPGALEQLQFIKVQTGRARQVVRNLSRFSSQQIGPPSPIDLRDVVSDVLRRRSRELEQLKISTDVHVSTKKKVHANVAELEQVTSHLLLNAIQAVEGNHPDVDSGRIEIRVFDSGINVRLEVHDNGVGVAITDEPKLFQPFFTTKPVGTGTGLSLSVSYGIIESYGGEIGYFRNPWGGATFFYELPAVTESTGRALSSPVQSQKSSNVINS